MELVAGLAVLSLAVSRILGGDIGLYTPKDGKINGWDLKHDDSYPSLIKELGYVDWTHMAPPCRTLTKRRRTDKHGSVSVRRTIDKPYGYGKEDEDADLLIEQYVAIAEEQLKRQAYFSVENPKDSFRFKCRRRCRRSKSGNWRMSKHLEG